MALTNMQKAAADHYLCYGDKSAALKAAGYSGKTNADYVFKNPKVLEYIEEQGSLGGAGKIASVEEIMEYLTRIMQGLEVERESVVVKTGKDTTDVKEVTKPLSAASRLKAAELLIKWHNGCEGEAVTPVVIRDDVK